MTRTSPFRTPYVEEARRIAAELIRQHSDVPHHAGASLAEAFAQKLATLLQERDSAVARFERLAAMKEKSE